jgi:(2Fe-2S) ferredoxin
MATPTSVQVFYVCVNTSCRGGGSLAVLEALRAMRQGTGDEVREQICFGACWMGPNVVLYPQGTWYCGVAPDDLEEIVAHAQGGPPVERLIDRSDPGLCEQIARVLKTIAG